MSGAGKRSESFAQSLFPFLAVLLCTMGALVLMLMLLISHAQSSAQETAEKVEEEIEWEKEKLKLVKVSLSRKYEDAKLDIEKKRLVLQGVEQHIYELTEELAQLEKTMESVESQKDHRQASTKELDKQRDQLEKQLAEAKQTLETKLKDPKGDKPIFAIIPYEGSSGTHRRPIYLECCDKGVVIQPEGVVISSGDLRPPYGPGNPLDAVLRTIRAEFPATNGSITSNPYPLLVVRPSGIKHYMMARAAMSGWDDQFGYELISEDLELTFPTSVPGLAKKIASTIETARQRQAALVMAMPQHYDASQLDLYRSPDGSWDGTAEDVSGMFDPSPSGGQSGIGNASTKSTGKRGGISMSGSSARKNNSDSAAGFAADNPPPNQNPLPPLLAQNSNGGSTKGDGWNFGQSLESTPGGNPGMIGSNTSGSDLGSNSTTGPAGTSGTMSFFGSEQGDASGAFATGSSRRGGTGGSGGVAGPSGYGSDGNDASGSSESSIADGGSATGPANGSGSATGKGSGSGTGPGGQGGGSASGNNMSGGGSLANSLAGGQASGGGMSYPGPLGSGLAAGSSDVNSNDPSRVPGELQGAGLNMDMSRQPSNRTGEKSVKPLSQSKGRGWAWRDGDRSETAIVRAIWLQCFNDRWVLRPDKGSNLGPVTIQLEGSPVQQAEKLARSVQQRVEFWGVAISGGHWSPVLHVEVASDAEARFQQLQRLMEGSGIEVIRKGTLPPRAR